MAAIVEQRSAVRPVVGSIMISKLPIPMKYRQAGVGRQYASGIFYGGRCPRNVRRQADRGLFPALATLENYVTGAAGYLSHC